MKSKLAFLFTLTLLFGAITMPGTQAFELDESESYSGIDYTNYYANSVLVDAGSVVEKSTAAYDSSNSFSLPKSDGTYMYVGFDGKFDGFAMDVDTSAANGSFQVTYWNGSSWSELVESNSGDIKNNSSTGVFKLEWDRPSNWSARTMSIDSPEDEDEDVTDSLYFVRLEIEDDYDNAAVMSRLGILNYNLVVEVSTEIGEELVINVESFDFTDGGNTEIYAHARESGVHYFAMHAYDDDYTYEVNVDGYILEESDVTLDTTRTEDEVELQYTHVIRAEDADDGEAVSITAAEAGTEDVECEIYQGDAYCPVETDDDNSTATVEASGYDDTSFTLPNRTSDSTAQKVTEIEMDSNGSGDDDDDDDDDDGVELTVTDLSMDDDELVVKVENTGDEDSDEAVDLYVYVDDDKEGSYEIDENYIEAGDTVNVTFDLDALADLDERVEVRACVDANDDIDEDNESNNCRTEYVGEEDEDEDIDFEVTEVYGDEDDFYYTLANTGDEDVTGSSAIKVQVTVEQDGDTNTVATTTYSNSDSNEFFEEGEESTYNLDDILEDYFDDGSDFDVTVCIDSDDDYDEASESNNCMTVDDGELDDEPSSDDDDDDSCGSFYDTDDHWAEEFICDLYDRDVVDGRTNTRFYPDYSITRAEFLKMVLLGLDYDPSSVSGVYYDDVSSRDWYYEYVTYATAHDIVDGYSDGTFRGDDYITRGEALVMLLRAADQEEDNADEEDINFWDVDDNDWFTWAVVLADEDGLISGYSDDSFRPENHITRGEASKIVDLAYQVYEE